MLLLFGHFVIPFVAIISKWVKRMRWALMVAAIWMLVFAWLDLFWLVMPVIPMDIKVACDSEAAEALERLTKVYHFLRAAGVHFVIALCTID